MSAHCRHIPIFQWDWDSREHPWKKNSYMPSMARVPFQNTHVVVPVNKYIKLNVLCCCCSVTPGFSQVDSNLVSCKVKAPKIRDKLLIKNNISYSFSKVSWYAKSKSPKHWKLETPFWANIPYLGVVRIMKSRKGNDEELRLRMWCEYRALILQQN